MTAPTRLAHLNAGGATAAPKASSKMQAVLSGRRVIEPIVLAGLDAPAMLVLVGSERFLDIEGEVLLAMEGRKIPSNMQHEGKFELEKAKRVLAEAVREHDPIAKAEGRVPPPFGTLADWGDVAPSIINAIWGQYAELVERYDPLGDVAELSALERMEILSALEKKSLASLRAFGLQSLCAFMLTTADQLRSSLTARSFASDGSAGPSSDEPQAEAPSDL